MQSDTFTVEKFPSLERYRSDHRGRTLDVLIATEEIIGPVRNGGIASTYYHLARGLARQGHRVSVLYLKGRRVENGTAEQWIEHYAEFGIDLIYLPESEEAVVAAAERWQTRYLAFYRWLRANDRFDVIHTSEWRGGAFYCLQAKQLGLAFRNTLFIVKTSSPHIWNRHYQMQPIDEPDLLTAAYAEQKCVEWADMVVGGSAHLLSFMRHIGYRIPDGRTYAQPNIIDFSEVKVTDLREERAFGEVMRSRELVFFGRLEPRKGLELFVNAMNALVSRGIAPSRLTFLGKEGERMGNQGGAKPLDFIAANAKRWPFPVDIVTDRNQPEALSYMCQRDMIAVMPSLIENSTMAVYEALVHRIPFVATGVGGTPELVGEAYHAACLIPPTAEALAGRLEAVLAEGQPIAVPAFDNQANLETWYAFHRYVAEHGPEALLTADQGAETQTRHRGDRLSLFVYALDHEHATALVRRLAPGEGAEFDEVFLCIPFLLTPTERAALSSLAPVHVRLVDSIGVSMGDAFNRAARTSLGEILVFDAGGSARFRPEFTGTVRRALDARPDSLVSSFFAFPDDPLDPDAEAKDHTLFMPMGGDIASQYATNVGYGAEVIALRAETLDAVGPFEPYHLSAGIVHEFVTRAVAGGREYFIIPEPLFDHAGRERPMTSLTENYHYLKSKAVLDAAPLHLKKVLLYYLGRRPGGRASRTVSFMSNANREEGATAWLTNVGKVGAPGMEELRRGPIVVGFDHRRSRLKLALWGTGEFRVTVNNELDVDEREYGRPGTLSIRFIEVLPLFERGDRIWVKVEFNNERNKRQRVLSLQRLEDHLYFLGSKRPVYWDDTFDAVVAELLAPPTPSAPTAKPGRAALGQPSAA